MPIHGRPWAHNTMRGRDWFAIALIGAAVAYGFWYFFINGWMLTGPNNDDPCIRETWHKGHLFLLSTRFNGSAPLIHSPDCPKCAKKDIAR